MADMTYNFNGLWKAFSSTGNETLSLSVYQGAASLVMFRRGTDSKRPVAKMSLGGAAVIKLKDILKSLMDAQPDTRAPFVQLIFNKESRNYEQATNFVFFKDDKRCFGVEVSNKLNPTPVKIMFKCANTFSTGAESMTDEQKSILALRELIQILEVEIPQAMLLSRFNMELPQRRGYGKNGGKGGYRNSGGGSKDPYAGSESGGDENIFG